ncbi:MAG: ATP-binding protein [Desulfobacterales bacterium]
MNCSELSEILDRGEDTTHQFKVNFTSIDALAAEMGAFVNTDGGMIIIGASDTGDPVGVSKEDIARLNQWIANAATHKFDKQIFVKTEILICDGKRILIIHVPRGVNKPYAVNRLDVWVKNGADKRRAPIEEVLRLAQTSGILFADETETDATPDDFDEEFFKSRYRKFYQEELEDLGIPFINFLTNLKLAANDRLTLAGLLLCGKNPERFRPQFIVKATCFDGNDISVQIFADKEEISGKLLDLYQKAKFFISRNLRRVQKDQDFNAPGILEIPEDAFSEIIANALIHRNYYISAPVQIFLFRNRLEIISPGNLPNTITQENIRFGVHIERNPILLSFLEKDREFKYTGRGSGIPKVLKVCKAEGVKVEFDDNRETQQFKVIFHREPVL